MTLKEIYEHLVEVAQNRTFLTSRGPTHSIPFYICPYPPEKQLEMTEYINFLKRELAAKNIRVLEINLYDIALEMLEEEGQLQTLLEMEEQLTSEQVTQYLETMLNPQKTVTPFISKKIAAADYDLLFITGVGESYPFIRAHTLLDNLQNYADEKPLIMFFPGAYNITKADGAALELFNLLHNDRYYRAFNINLYNP